MKNRGSYSDAYGLAYTEPEELTCLATKRSQQGWQLAIHANGDRAIDNVLDALEAVQAAGIEVRSLRPRIENRDHTFDGLSCFSWKHE